MSKGYLIEFEGKKFYISDDLHFEANDINRALINSGKRPTDRFNHILNSGNNVLVCYPTLQGCKYHFFIAKCDKNKQPPMLEIEKAFWLEQLAIVDQQD